MKRPEPRGWLRPQPLELTSPASSPVASLDCSALFYTSISLTWLPALLYKTGQLHPFSNFLCLYFGTWFNTTNCTHVFTAAGQHWDIFQSTGIALLRFSTSSKTELFSSDWATPRESSVTHFPSWAYGNPDRVLGTERPRSALLCTVMSITSSPVRKTATHRRAPLFCSPHIWIGLNIPT